MPGACQEPAAQDGGRDRRGMPGACSSNMQAPSLCAWLAAQLQLLLSGVDWRASPAATGCSPGSPRGI